MKTFFVTMMVLVVVTTGCGKKQEQRPASPAPQPSPSSSPNPSPTPSPSPAASNPGAPVTPAPVTPAPVTPAPVTPAPVTPAPVTPAPVTPAPVTPAPVTPAPVTQPAPLQGGCYHRSLEICNGYTFRGVRETIQTLQSGYRQACTGDWVASCPAAPGGCDMGNTAEAQDGSIATTILWHYNRSIAQIREACQSIGLPFVRP